MPKVLTSQNSNCKNCYKCIRNCPVKAIRFSGNQAHIMEDDCVLCGQCYTVCPQEAKLVRDDVETAQVLLHENETVVASVAPSFVAYFKGTGFAALREALIQLGFADAGETALGATLVKREYDRMVNDGKREPIVSSCCHSVNLLVQKYYPQALPFLASVTTPMLAHGKLVKQQNPAAKTVFIGPCISKKAEAEAAPGVIDCVLTFPELEAWFAAEGIKLEKAVEDVPGGKTRFFPTCGGILKSMDCENTGYTYLAVDGMESCMAALQDLADGKLENCFIEMSACAGSCAGGPVMGKCAAGPVGSYMAVANVAGSKDFDVPALDAEEMQRTHPYLGRSNKQPGAAALEEILQKMGKFSPEDELNCGSCGYNTCREKAVAIFQGKADYSMCLPFLKDKAESFSDNIINNTPNGIIVLNEALEVQQINTAALKLMQIGSEKHVLGEPVVRILDPGIFTDVLESEKEVFNRRVYLAEYQKYVEQTVLFDGSYRIIICIMRDVTEDEVTREAKEQLSRKTIETANQVVEKQMRAVQEIASLLGETTAETKIALTKLKESLADE